jgi:hypothetical protein
MAPEVLKQEPQLGISAAFVVQICLNPDWICLSLDTSGIITVSKTSQASNHSFDVEH